MDLQAQTTFKLCYKLTLPVVAATYSTLAMEFTATATLFFGNSYSSARLIKMKFYQDVLHLDRIQGGMLQNQMRIVTALTLVKHVCEAKNTAVDSDTLCAGGVTYQRLHLLGCGVRGNKDNTDRSMGIHKGFTVDRNGQHVMLLFPLLKDVVCAVTCHCIAVE